MNKYIRVCRYLFVLCGLSTMNVWASEMSIDIFGSAASLGGTVRLPTDLSLNFLRILFGNILSGTDSMLLGEIFYIFNLGLLAICMMVVTVTNILAVVYSSKEGKVMGQKLPTAWIIVRSTTSVMILAPVIKGYSFVQVFVLLMVLQGINLADVVWDTVLSYTATYGSVVDNQVKNYGMESTLAVDATSLQSYVQPYITVAQSVLESELCYLWYVDQYNRCTQEQPGARCTSPIVTVVNHQIVYELHNNFPAEGSPPTCGSLLPNASSNTRSTYQVVDATSVTSPFNSSDKEVIDSRFTAFTTAIYYPMSTLAKLMYTQQQKHSSLFECKSVGSSSSAPSSSAASSGSGVSSSSPPPPLSADGIDDSCYVGYQLYNAAMVYWNVLNQNVIQPYMGSSTSLAGEPLAKLKDYGWLGAGFSFSTLSGSSESGDTATRTAMQNALYTKLYSATLTDCNSTDGYCSTLKTLQDYLSSGKGASETPTIQATAFLQEAATSMTASVQGSINTLGKYVATCNTDECLQNNIDLTIPKTSALVGMNSQIDQDSSSSPNVTYTTLNELQASHQKRYINWACMDPILGSMITPFHACSNAYGLNEGLFGDLGSAFSSLIWTDSYPKNDTRLDEETQWFIVSIGQAWMKNFGWQAVHSVVKNPISSMTNFGQALMVNSLTYLNLALVDIYQNVVNIAITYYERIKAMTMTTMILAGTIKTLEEIEKWVIMWPWWYYPIKGMVAVMYGLQQVLMSLAPTLMTAMQMQIQMEYRWVPLLIAGASFILGLGVFIQFYVPVIPLFIFLITVMGWFISVVEAMVAAPLVAVGMAYPVGHDFLGRAESSMLLLFSVFVRPSAIILGFVFSIILVWLGMLVLNILAMAMLTDFISDVMTTSAGCSSGSCPNGSYITVVMALLMYMYIVLQVINQSFSLTYSIPNRLMRWINGGAAEEGQEQQIAEQFQGEVQQIGDTAQKGGEGMGQSIGSIMGIGIQGTFINRGPKPAGEPDEEEK